MTGHLKGSALSKKEPRIDSGAALSDPGVSISSQFSAKKPHMSEPNSTRWDFSAAKAQYYEGELQLRQPEGFPIIPLPNTLARAFVEAERAAAAKNYAEPEFNIYEDADNGTLNAAAKACEKMDDTEPGTVVGEEREDDNNGDENERVSNENEHGALPTTANVAKVGQTHDVPVDTLGRTRAANRRKALEAIKIEDSLEGKEEGNSKKRKRRSQKFTQPKKPSVRKSR